MPHAKVDTKTRSQSRGEGVLRRHTQSASQQTSSKKSKILKDVERSTGINPSFGNIVYTDLLEKEVIE